MSFVSASTESRPAGSTTTTVSASASVVTLLSANVLRRGASIYNDSAALLYVKMGTGASLSSFTAQISPGGIWPLPFPVYTGSITGIWDTAVGNARVTEISE